MFKNAFFKIEKVVVTALLLLIRAYQLLISPWTQSHCRFYPSCSHYAKEVINRFGSLRGLYFTLRRLVRCHPFHPGGYDPIPKRETKN